MSNPLTRIDANIDVLNSIDCVKIKQERTDPEIEEKLNSKLLTEELYRKQPSANGAGSGGYKNSNPAHRSPEVDEKKSIEPIKSSNQILTELFKVFNAAPPEELFDDNNLIQKSKQNKNKKKKKKKSKDGDKMKSERDDHNSSTSSDTEDSSSDSTEIQRKLDKKHSKEKLTGVTVKPEKEKNRIKSRHSEKFGNEKKNSNKHTEEETSKLSRKNTHKRSAHDSLHEMPQIKHNRTADGRIAERSTEIRHNRFYDGFREKRGDRERSRSREYKRRSTSYERKHSKSRERRRSRSRDSKWNNASSSSHKRSDSPSGKSREQFSNRKRSEYRATGDNDDDILSELSLSDEEESYLHRSEYGTRTSDNRRRRPPSPRQNYDQHKPYNEFYRNTDTRTRYNRERMMGDDSRSRYRCHRSRSRTPSRDLGIDKKRLLEIARKNAISMFKRGSLPGCAEMSEEVKDKVLLKMRYGGRTVQDLTDFCKKLTNGKNLNEISDLSSDEDSDIDKSGKPKAFNHPFIIKDREEIVMDIRGAVSKIPQQKPSINCSSLKAITMQFPVSSGQQHRLSEAWVPVNEPKAALPPLPTLPAVKPAVSIFKPASVKNVFEKPVPVEQEQKPAFKPINTRADSVTLGDTSASLTAATIAATTATATISENTAAAATSDIVPDTLPPPFVPDVPIPSSNPSSNCVFAEGVANNFDVSSIITKRLNAMRRLQDNPMDSEAIKMMHNSQMEMSSWASSKYLPGQFTGSSGVNKLTARQLNAGPQAWARRDQLTSTLPVTGGRGMHLLQKMGWKPGEGLGREKSGTLQPLLLDVKLDKRGLVSDLDNGNMAKAKKMSKKLQRNAAQVQRDLQGKHPVSLLNELTSKRKWMPPMYQLINEGGPSHSKMFLFAVSVNGQLYTPSEGANTKKDAKVKAARYCLQQIGILPA